MTPTEQHNDLVRRGYLVNWTIYHRPVDYPDGYIARANVAGVDGEIHATSATITGDTLEIIREQLPPGLTCFQASDDDLARCIVESWM